MSLLSPCFLLKQKGPNRILLTRRGMGLGIILIPMPFQLDSCFMYVQCKNSEGTDPSRDRLILSPGVYSLPQLDLLKIMALFIFQLHTSFIGLIKYRSHNYNQANRCPRRFHCRMRRTPRSRPTLRSHIPPALQARGLRPLLT